MTIKIWDGSAFVDGNPRIWNGSAFVPPSAVHRWDGTQFVKIWPDKPEFVQAVGVEGTNQAPAVSLNKATAGSKILIGTTSNSYGSLGVTMDGVALTPFGFVSSTRVHQFFIVDATAGNHDFVVDGGGSWETMIVSEYKNISEVGAYTSKVSSSQLATHTPDGSGKLAVAFVAGVAASSASPNYVGTPRYRQVGDANNQSIALIDSETAPLGINASGSAMSVGCVWLS